MDALIDRADRAIAERHRITDDFREVLARAQVEQLRVRRDRARYKAELRALRERVPRYASN